MSRLIVVDLTDRGFNYIWDVYDGDVYLGYIAYNRKLYSFKACCETLEERTNATDPGEWEFINECVLSSKNTLYDAIEMVEKAYCG